MGGGPLHLGCNREVVTLFRCLVSIIVYMGAIVIEVSVIRTSYVD